MTSRNDYNNPHGSGELSLAYHYEMVSDIRRVGPFRKAIEEVCNGKVVLESGAGTGILSLLAARAGAAQVYAIELDADVATFARHNIENKQLRNIKLIEKNTLKVAADDINNQKADVVIAEHLSTWQVTEPQLQVLNHINAELVALDAVRLPATIYNYLELTHSEYTFEDVIDLRTHYFQFSGIPAPETFSEPVLFAEFDLSYINVTTYSDSVYATVTHDGVLNGLRLTSPLKVYNDITFSSSDSLMPPVIVPLETDLEVHKGAIVQVFIEYETNTTWEQFNCHAELVE